MTSSFGARLRQQREERGIPLSLIAGQTKSRCRSSKGSSGTIWRTGRRASFAAPTSAPTLTRSVGPRRPGPRVPRDLSRAAGDCRPAVTAQENTPRRTAGRRPGSATSSGPRWVLVAAAPRNCRRGSHSTAGDVRQRDDAARPAGAVRHAGSSRARRRPRRDTSPSQLCPLRSSPRPRAGRGRRPEYLSRAAELCTHLGRVENASPDAAAAARSGPDSRCEGSHRLGVGHDRGRAAARPRLRVFGQGVRTDSQPKPGADNLTAAAFRSAETLAMIGTADASAALAVPLLTPGACSGVLAIELPHGLEEATPVARWPLSSRDAGRTRRRRPAAADAGRRWPTTRRPLTDPQSLSPALSHPLRHRWSASGFAAARDGLAQPRLTPRLLSPCSFRPTREFRRIRGVSSQGIGDDYESLRTKSAVRGIRLLTEYGWGRARCSRRPDCLDCRGGRELR